MFYNTSALWWGTTQCSDPSVCPSVRSFVCANGAFHAYGYYRTPIVNPVLEVEPAGQHGRMDTGSGRRERRILF